MIEKDLIQLDNLGDLGISEMNAPMRLHSQEVTRFTAGITAWLIFSDEQLKQFRSDCEAYKLDSSVFLKNSKKGVIFSQIGIFMVKICAKVHDVGKPFFRHICALSRSLTPKEFDEQKLHADISRVIVKSWLLDSRFDFQNPGLVHFVADMASSHHEKFDGTGYPDGKAGSEIGFIARILAIADAISAGVNPRPYKKTQPFIDCLKRLGTSAGSHFDPALVEYILRLGTDKDTEPRVSGEWLDENRLSTSYMEFAVLAEKYINGLPQDKGDFGHLGDVRKIIRQTLERNKSVLL